MYEQVPATPADIPGLGPIRLRALVKAGYDSVLTIKSADVETLSAVRGITEIKAKYIANYFSQFSVEQLKTAIELTNKPQAKATLVQWESDDTPMQPAVLPVSIEAARAMSAVIRVLTSPHGSLLRNRLVAAFERFGLECLALVTEAVTIPDKDAEKALRRLRKSSESLIDISKHIDLDKKDQGRLADEISDLSSWISELRVDSAVRNHRGNGHKEPKHV